MKLTEAIFDEKGKLKIYTKDTWEDKWLQLVYPAVEEDLPF